MEYRFRFDDKCRQKVDCSFDIYIREDVPGPIYFYIHFDKFFLNHRKVMRSFNKEQLRGKDLPVSTIETNCGSKSRNKDLSVTSYLFAPNNPVEADGPLNPCGILPSLMSRGSNRLT